MLGVLLLMIASAFSTTESLHVSAVTALPQEWRGITCESYAFFRDEKLAAYELDIKNLSRKSSLSFSEARQQSKVLLDKISGLTMSKPQKAEVSIEIDLPENFWRTDVGSIIGVNSLSDGAIFLNVSGITEFSKTSLVAESKKLLTTVNIGDICAQKSIHVNLYTDCKLDPITEEFCIGEGVCQVVYNGYSPDQCSTKVPYQVSLKKISDVFKKIERSDLGSF